MSKKVEKKITMRATDANKWLKGLRSGDFPQASGELCRMDFQLDPITGKTKNVPLGYCCLGVMQKVMTGKVQEHSLPTLRWLKDHGIKAEHGEIEDFDRHDRRTAQVDIKIDPVKSKKHSYTTYDSLATLNDSGEFSFKEIANIIEKNLKKVKK